jgi:hypothetical protein
MRTDANGNAEIPYVQASDRTPTHQHTGQSMRTGAHGEVPMRSAPDATVNATLERSGDRYFQSVIDNWSKLSESARARAAAFVESLTTDSE